MGYLDEAIRDHLALQRQRGVAREELERAEAEALGPVAAADLAESVSERTVEDLEEAAEAPEPDAVPEPEREPETALDEARSGSSDGPAEPDRDQPTAAYDLADLDELLETEPQPEPTSDEARSGSSGGAPEPDRASDDPLEETPDFLQETPEHDRLWFEQKPPKDFDF